LWRADEKLAAFIGLESPIWQRVKDWKIIMHDLSKSRWSWGCVSGVNSNGRRFFCSIASGWRAKNG
jgi:hypothetical protein